MRFLIIFGLFLFLISGCAGGVTNIKTASDQQLFSDLKTGSAWLPPGHHARAREEIRKRHPEYDWYNIDRRKIKVGMSKMECILSWGFPYRVNRASYGEQWVYNHGYTHYYGQYLYFSGNKCTAFN